MPPPASAPWVISTANGRLLDNVLSSTLRYIHEMFRPSTRRLAEAIPKLTGQNNPYKAQKEWPPDFSKLHPKHQFRLERRYRRRSKLKWARPRWTKAVKLTAWGSSAFVLVYGILFMDWGEMAGREVAPFAGIREWFHETVDSIWTASPKTRHNPAIVLPKDNQIQNTKG